MSSKEEKINFEEAMKRLEEIAIELEKGELNLDESVIKFEEGMKLSKECSSILEQAQKKINILLTDATGNVTEENFIPDEE